MVKHVLWDTCTIFFAALYVNAVAKDIYKKVSDGIIINLPQKSIHEAPLLRLQAISDKIIHITATPKNPFPSIQSLMAIQIITKDKAVPQDSDSGNTIKSTTKKKSNTKV